MIATQGGQPEAVQVLFQVGTNKDLKERKCRNASELARESLPRAC